MRLKIWVVGLLTVGLLSCPALFAKSSLSKMTEWFSSKKRSTTVTGTIEAVEGRKILFKSDDGQTLELTGRKSEKLMDQKGATLRIFGNVRKPDGKYPVGGLEVRNYRVVEAAKPAEPTPAPEPVVEPAPEPVMEPTPEPVAEPTPEPAPIEQPVAIESAPMPNEVGPAAGSASSYKVEKGDTLAKISKKMYGTTKKWKSIAEANNIKNPKALKVGMTLNIPQD